MPEAPHGRVCARPATEFIHTFPFFPVTAHFPRAVRQQTLRGFFAPRRSRDGPPRIDQQALEMEEGSGIDNELRRLEFG